VRTILASRKIGGEAASVGPK